jgi:hypothetical protein
LRDAPCARNVGNLADLQDVQMGAEELGIGRFEHHDADVVAGVFDVGLKKGQPREDKRVEQVKSSHVAQPVFGDPPALIDVSIRCPPSVGYASKVMPESALEGGMPGGTEERRRWFSLAQVETNHIVRSAGTYRLARQMAPGINDQLAQIRSPCAPARATDQLSRNAAFRARTNSRSPPDPAPWRVGNVTAPAWTRIPSRRPRPFPVAALRLRRCRRVADQALADVRPAAAPSP